MRRYDKHNRSVMKPRFIWLLEALCANSGVDPQLIDPKLTYSENKDNIERITGLKLRLKGEANLKGVFHSAADIDPDELAKWESLLEWYNARLESRKAGRKTRKCRWTSAILCELVELRV